MKWYIIGQAIQYREIPKEIRPTLWLLMSGASRLRNNFKSGFYSDLKNRMKQQVLNGDLSCEQRQLLKETNSDQFLSEYEYLTRDNGNLEILQNILLVEVSWNKGDVTLLQVHTHT